MVHRREINSQEIVLGNQGDLYQRAMTWWDHGTGSVWSQPLGEAILGPLAGSRLELLPSTLTDWSTWRDAHPGTLALDAEGGPTRLSLEQMLIVVELAGEAAGYPIPAVREAGGVVNDIVRGEPVAVLADPTISGRWAVFSRRVGERVVELRLDRGRLVDTTSGSIWEPARGEPLSGPLAVPLVHLPAFTEFPRDFSVHFPGARIWEGG